MPELLSYYTAQILLVISFSNPMPPLALEQQWRQCIETCEECGDIGYEECDIQYDPYEILQYSPTEANDGRNADFSYSVE